MPGSICTEGPWDAPKHVEQQKSKETQPLTTQSSLDEERELARKRAQERRKREAVSTICFSDPFVSFHLILVKKIMLNCFAVCFSLLYRCLVST